jgi:hypothetical protein
LNEIQCENDNFNLKGHITMKQILYKTSLLLAMLILANNTNAYADETVKPADATTPNAVVKTEETVSHGAKTTTERIEQGAEATAQGIERGAKATARGIEHGAKAVERGVKRGVEATAHGIERGAEATRNAAHTVVEKVQGKEYDEPHPANEGPDQNRK